MMEAISQQIKIESSLDDEEHINDESTTQQLIVAGSQNKYENDLDVDTEMGNEEKNMQSDEMEINNKRYNSDIPTENIEETSQNEALDAIKSTDTEENESNQSFSTFKEFEENCIENEAESEKSQSYNLDKDEKIKITEYDDHIEDEMKNMHSPETVSENINVSVDSKEPELSKSDADDQREKEAVVAEVEKEQIQAEIEIEDSSDSSINEVNNDDRGSSEENKDHDIAQKIYKDDDYITQKENQVIEKSNTNEDKGKEIVSISDEESMQSINETQDTEQIDSLNTNDINEIDIQQHDVINLDDESQDDVKILEDTVQEGEHHKESECVAIIEESQDKVMEKKELKCVSNKDIDMEKLSKVNDFVTDIIRRSPSSELLNGNENSNDNLKIDVADEEGSRQSKSEIVENIVNECDEQHEQVYDVDLKNVISDDNSLVNSIKRQILKLDFTTELPKLNGDHNAPETDQINSAVIEIHENSQSSESAKVSEMEFKREKCSSGEDDNDEDNLESNLKIVDDDAQLLPTSHPEASPHLNETVSEKLTKEPMQIDHVEDECSRSSIASMVSSSTATSSSHHLVIDDTEAVKKTKKQRRNAQLTRKRKQSQNSGNSETSPRYKQARLDLVPEPVTNTVLNENSYTPRVNCQIEDGCKIEEASITYHYENTVAPIVLQKSSEILVQSSPSRSSPLLNSLLTKKNTESMEKLSATTNVKLNNTKYLCFNCKSGSFDSLIALNEHQRQCLVNKLILPPPITITTNTPPQSPENKIAAPNHNVSRNQLSENTVEKLRYYKCSSCGTFHENWNLFLHIREIHKRHICLYCIRMFPTAEKLSLHLEIKHDLEQNHFNTEEALRKSLEHKQTEIGTENRFLMCCTCQHVFLQSDPFSDHICTEYMQACNFCGQKGRHTNQCKTQTEAKRSRVKKKAKDASTGRQQARASDALSMAPQSEPFPNPPETKSNCDNLPIQTTLPPSTLSHTTPVVLQQQNEDSNSSCNMVIDETCNNTNYSRITPYNPFKALDERERLEQQKTWPEPVLTPDRYSGILEQAMEKPAPMQPLIVPKLKLRVPKEFQKSVDAAISSTESEEDDEVNEEEIETSPEVLPAISTTLNIPQVGVSTESATEPATEVPNSHEEPQEHRKHNMTIDDEDSLEEPNSNLVRILQEIERTKLDIMRTKDALQTAKSPITASMQRPATISQSSSRTGAERNWTPTPPASPNPQWSTPRRALSHNEKVDQEEIHHEFKEDFVPPITLMPMENQERRDTTGSEMDMDIDETISGQPTMCIQRSAPPSQVTEEAKEAEEIKAETTNDQEDSSNENSSMNIDDFGGSKESVEEHSNSFAYDKPDKTQDHTGEDAQKEEEPVVEEPTHQPSLKVDTPPITSVAAKAIENEDNHMDVDVCNKEDKFSESHLPPTDGIEVADDDTIPVDLQLDRPLEKFEIIEFVRICLKAVYPLCLYCNHARRIAVNGKSLVLHLIAQHRFAATVDSITAEELQPGTIVAKLKSYLAALDDHFFNSTSYCTMGDGAYTRHFNERIFECFQCRFVTSTHKELYLHNRKMHIKTAILCFMCRANFFSFSEILCHICPGEPYKTSVFDVKFRCCLCDVDNIPSPFRLMVHLRKKHFACDVCLEDCRDQGRLSSHVWKHKLHHLCYRCGIAYRNKMDITKHLFWKHGTESIICKRCLQKRWRHVYHFCIPPSNFICDICTLCFSKATYLKVHKRIHTGDLRYPCTEENCEQRFISRRLLLKHTVEHQLPELPETKASDVEKKEEVEQKSEVQKPEEVKIKDEKFEDAEVKVVKGEVKADAYKQDIQATAGIKTNSLDDPKTVATDTDKPRKKKKNKRNKESLEDLNLIAPNLSESDSSDDSDVESKSKSGEDALVPKVMLSPPSDAEHDKDGKDKSGAGKVLEIWQNFLQSQGSTSGEHRNETDYTEDYYPTPNSLHVVQSDHDYCVMFKPIPYNNRYGNTSQTSPVKARKTTAKSPRRNLARRSNASSSSSGSSSSSDSSCSCGSNCSCSSSNSDSSSSSSSSDDSSSGASNVSRKRHRKKSDRMRKKSESGSPNKKHTNSEAAAAKANAAGSGDYDVNVGTDEPTLHAPSPPKEPLFYESDLETAESETDEEFYDEHPQKLASELLAQKRAQLMAQTRLSPSHNYDIVENSRPSTPSLPDEVAREKKVKLKKKKRERKSTSRSVAQTVGVPALKLQFGKAPALNAENIAAVTAQQQSTLTSEVAQSSLPPHTFHEMLPAYELMRQSPNIAEIAVTQEQQRNPNASNQLFTPHHHTGRMSEGSSCSDADASLKRSKRARRPNKFYGYTSDDENIMSGLGQPLMIGMRAIKPQPPPQLTWRKEDLPTPSKSIINNKSKTPRTPKTPGVLPIGPFGTNLNATATSNKKRVRNSTMTPGVGDQIPRKRLTKKAVGSLKLPPIPTLKIRPSQIGLTPTNTVPNVVTGPGGTNHIPASQIYSSSKESDDEEEEDSTDSSSDDEATQKLLLNAPVASTSNVGLWNAAFQQVPAVATVTPVTVPPTPTSVVFQASLVLPPVLPALPPPTPQASAFNQKIPPALLPNPDFATLQYFKANNIRYPIRPPAGARQAREGESVYCYCRCPYDEVSEMIACDGDNCLIEWFHFECVGIMVAPQGKWFCAECRPKYSEELYPAGKA